jgi:hypothetical protein
VPALGGTVATISVVVALLTIPCIPLKKTCTCEISLEKREPVMVTVVPLGPVSGIIPEITGLVAGAGSFLSFLQDTERNSNIRSHEHRRSGEMEIIIWKLNPKCMKKLRV